VCAEICSLCVCVCGATGKQKYVYVCVEKKPEGLRESSKQTAKVGFCLGIQQENHRGCLFVST
jgi:hypothetical protein